MNERIKQLAVAAAPANSSIPHSEWNIPKEFIEKFAELIVKECVNVVDGGSFLHDQAPTAIFAKECSAAIKRHFGVKE